MDGDKKSRLEHIKTNLYSRKEKALSFMNKGFLRKKTENVSSDWNDININEAVENTVEETVGPSIFKKILTLSIVFFVISVTVSFFIFFNGNNKVSVNNIDISVIGPTSVSGGDELPLDILVDNRNSIDLQLVDLNVEFPDGTKRAENANEDYLRFQDDLGTIKSGETARRTIKALIFGEEGEKKPVKVTLTYRVPGSNAVFQKSTSYDVAIGTSPITVSVSSLKETYSNQDASIEVTISSNSSVTMKNLLLQVRYPFGFTLGNTSPKPEFGDSIWNIGDLEPKGKRTIKITGKIVGQDEEEKIFTFTVGNQSPNDQKVISSVFTSVAQSILISKPFLALSMGIDEDQSSEHIAVADKTIKGLLKWKNNLPEKITDLIIQLKFSGSMLNKTMVTSQGGYYSSQDNIITWNKDNYVQLSELATNESGSAGFNFAGSQSATEEGNNMRNPQIQIDVNIHGKRLSESGVPEDIYSTITKIVKFSTNLALTSNMVHFVGAFENTGPIPPKVDQLTSYTATWTVTNTTNYVSNAKVVATLPVYVNWTSKSYPSDEKISFDPANRQITWNVGEVKAGTGFSLPPRTVSFQVSFTASASQVGTAPSLISGIVLSGTDRFTGVDLSTKTQVLSTRINSDPQFSPQDDIVQH
ncbi:MAG: hypothetical protein WCW87_00350 [Candidatus Paceibacterota bacterium]